MIKNVAKWVVVGGKKYGLVTEHKASEALHFARQGKDDKFVFPATNTPSDELIAVLYARHGGLIVDEKMERVSCDTFWDFPAGKPSIDLKQKKEEDK